MNELENGKRQAAEVGSQWDEYPLDAAYREDVQAILHANQMLQIQRQLEGMRADIAKRLQSMAPIVAQAKHDHDRIRFKLFAAYNLEFDDTVSFDLDRNLILRRKG